MLSAKPASIADAYGLQNQALQRGLTPYWRSYTRCVSLFKSASTVSVLTLLSRVAGLARELLVASLFGASAMTDAFNVAFRIPNLFRRLFAEGAFSQAFVPVLSASKTQQGEEKTRVLINHVATLLTWVLILTCIVGVAAAPLLVWAMASGLQQNPQGYEAAVLMTRFMFPYIGFMSLAALCAGVLNTWKHFAVPAASPVLLNLSMIGAAIWLAPWLGRQGIEPIYGLAAGVMVGGVLQLLVQVSALRRMGLWPQIALHIVGIRAAWEDPGSRRIGALMLPALLGVSVAQLSLLINTQIASHLPTGSVSWLSYSDRLMEFPTAMLGVATGVVLMPQLAAARAAGQSAQYSALLDWGLRIVVLMAVPSALALGLFAGPMVAVLYNYGAFGANDVHQTTLALTGYAAGLLGIVALKVLTPGYYANQDIKTPVRIAVLVLVLTQLLNLVLVPWLHVAGLSLSIGLGAMLNAGFLLAGLMRRGTFRPEPGWGRFLLQVFVGSAVLGLYLWWAASAVDWVGLRAEKWYRIGLFTLTLAGAAVLYLGCVTATGLKLRQFLKR